MNNQHLKEDILNKIREYVQISKWKLLKICIYFFWNSIWAKKLAIILVKF